MNGLSLDMEQIRASATPRDDEDKRSNASAASAASTPILSEHTDEPGMSKTEVDLWVERIAMICSSNKALGRTSKLLPFVYVGSFMDAGDLIKLKLLGITHVVNCCAGQARMCDGFYDGKMEYLEIHAEDEDGYNILEHLPKMRLFVDQAKNSGGKVLIHCHAGQNRSVALAVAYAAQKTRQPVLKLIETVVKDRRLVLNNISFRRQLVEWSLKNNQRLI